VLIEHGGGEPDSATHDSGEDDQQDATQLTESCSE
jgi:hypothetical protein